MTTVVINGRFLTQQTTGVQRYAMETLRALDELCTAGQGPRGIELSVLAPLGSPDPGLRAIPFRRVAPLRGNAWEQLTLPLAARGHWLLSFSATGPIGKRDQVVTMHDAAVVKVPEAYSPSFRSWYRLLLPVLAHRLPKIMTVSEFSKGEISRAFGADPRLIRVAGAGWQHITRLASDDSVISKFGLEPKRYALAVSSVAPHKNFAVVGRAMARLNHRDLPIVVAGSANSGVFGGMDMSSLRSVKWVGYVSDEHLRALYEQAAVFVFPSLYEGFGIPPLEAMALGCPVLAANAAAIPEVCGDAAWYFPPQDDAALATLLERIMLDPVERAELAARGKQRIARFSWTSCARHFVDVLQELAAS